MQNIVNKSGFNDEIRIEVFYFDRIVDPLIKMMVPVKRFNRKEFCFSDYDIIHTNGIRPDLFAFLYRRKIKYHISTIHNFVFEDLFYTYNSLVSWFFGNIWLMFWKRADKLVCVSEAEKTYYAKWLPISKLEVIYNGIDGIDNSILPDNDLVRSINDFHSKGLKVIGSAAIITERKGIDQVLHLIAAEKNLALVIIGDGKELTNLVNLSEKLKISDRCLFCGFRSNASVYLRYFDIFVMPSRSEGFGLALIEAVQQKVPAICSDLEVFKELFNEDELTFFKLEDLTSLAKAIKTAMETGHKKAELAHMSYENNYTASLMVKHYYELYKSA